MRIVSRALSRFLLRPATRECQPRARLRERWRCGRGGELVRFEQDSVGRYARHDGRGSAQAGGAGGEAKVESAGAPGGRLADAAEGGGGVLGAAEGMHDENWREASTRLYACRYACRHAGMHAGMQVCMQACMTRTGGKPPHTAAARRSLTNPEPSHNPEPNQRQPRLWPQPSP